MRVHWSAILVGVAVGYWVLPKVIPAVKSKAS